MRGKDDEHFETILQSESCGHVHFFRLIVLSQNGDVLLRGDGDRYFAL